MSLIHLIYVSRREPALADLHLSQIVKRSAFQNAKRDISGVLLCFGNDLMQVLEGELTAVTSLFEIIKTDKRHTAIECLVCKPVKKRMFPEWSMGLADLDSKATLDRARLVRMVEDIRASGHAGSYSAEARILISDFRQQLETSVRSDRMAG